MKKTLFILLIIFAIIVIYVLGTIVNLKFEQKKAQKTNLEFEYILDKEMYGTDVVTIINKAMNNNIQHEVLKDSNGNYLNDDMYSIQVKISFVGIDELFTMEKICQAGLNDFMKAFNLSKFKCTKKEYHKNNNRISNIILEEI